MLKPVLTNMRAIDKVLGFAHFEQSAAAILGARAKLYEVRINGNFAEQDAQYHEEYVAAKAASDAATAALGGDGKTALSEDEQRAYAGQVITGGKLSDMRRRSSAGERAQELRAMWTEKAVELMGGEPRIALPQIVNHENGPYLTTHVFLLAREIPIGRTLDEALNDPIGYHPRTRKKEWAFSGINAVKTTVDLPKTYARESAALKYYHGLIAADAVKLIQGEEDGRYRARLTYWKLDPVALKRDREPERVETGDQFDLWGAWHPEEIARTIGSGKDTPTTNLSEPEEGSGRRMGV